MPAVAVKICGLTTADAVAAAVRGGARYLGFVFFQPSPRCLSPAAAAALAAPVPALQSAAVPPPGIARVGLVVDACDALLEAIMATVPLEMLQLHGHEPPERVAALKARFGLPVIKAIGIAERTDLGRIADYEDVADWLLFDARPPAGAVLPGGNARPFDWALLRGVHCARPWFLAGGLDADNVAEALAASGAAAVDVSSGVEDRPGVKNLAKVARFLDVVRALAADPAPRDHNMNHRPLARAERA